MAIKLNWNEVHPGIDGKDGVSYPAEREFSSPDDAFLITILTNVLSYERNKDITIAVDEEQPIPIDGLTVTAVLEILTS